MQDLYFLKKSIKKLDEYVAFLKNKKSYIFDPLLNLKISPYWAEYFKDKLLIKVSNNVYCINKYCPHNGLPLLNAKIYDNGVIICQFHHCKFSIFHKTSVPESNIIYSELFHENFQN
jgi:hypothetical protein